MKKSILFISVVVLMFIGITGGATHGSNSQIDICCAWNGNLSDGDLTYKISGGDATAQATVRAAIEDWETAVPGLTLTELTGGGRGNKTKANINVKFKKGGGVIAGQALRKFKNNSVTSVNLTISGSAFGLPSNQATIAEITRHEMGHALGTGHANFDDLMDPTVGGFNNISPCDVDAVEAANHWALVEGVPTSHSPHVDHVGC